mmetsp:Transcript_32504/g.32237  ORF Transcript_32504/g.32237 Transcript_32504/m.32237 type:complete len:168 (-) Transcript_32504:27-530(-)
MEFTFELFPEYTLYLQLYINLTNSSELRANVRNFECAFINPSLITSVKHILVAANRAISGVKTNTKKTDSIYSDLVYYLSPSSNIRGTLSQFGIQDSSTSIIIACFEPHTLHTMDSAIQGSKDSLDNLASFTNFKEIQSIFKISDSELSIDHSFTNAVSSRIALKDL